MAFGGTGFNFGSTNNQSSGFGSGFGSNTNNSTPAFGAATSTTGFGASTANPNPFGGATNSFGSNNNTGFGANNNTGSLFGNKAATPFGGGSTASGGLFGNNNNNASSGFGAGGFGTSNASTGFGSANTNTSSGGGFAFGSNNNKTGFGTSTTGGSLFGQGGAGTTGGFGSTGTGFGNAGSGTALNQTVPPSDGTASTPFAATTETETNGTKNSYQSINFQQPYQKYSFEELRVGDYNAGRRYGNASGQPGAFGNAAFGGFGSNNTGFGNTGAANTASNPFGSTAATTGFGTNTSTGFGNNNNTASGGLFGSTANKPGGLFGAATTSSSTTGGLFGTAGATNNAFGGAGTAGFGTNTNTGGGLFGNTQNKPAGGLFGGGNNSAQSGGNSLFGNNSSTTASGGGLFGNASNNNTSGGLFGANNQSTNTGGGLFGNANSNQQKPAGLFGGGAFGSTATQTQPTGNLFGTTNNATAGTGGGLFGNTNTNTNTGGGLFGNAGSTNTGGGLFGNNNNNSGNAGGGLFGNNQQQNQAKPTGLFGTSTTGGGLFGNANNNNSTTGGLFGNNAASTSGGLFGNTQNKPAGGLFGNANTTQTGSGLFGTSNNGGLFGASQNNQQQNQQQTDGVKHASLLDPNPYGQSSIWTGLPAASPENSKPVFTPLTASQKLKESMMKPPSSLRLNQSRYMTPPRRNGYGFSYSSYGTPNSAASTPGGVSLSGSMYGSRGWSGGSFGRSFNKSASVQNLRAQFSSENDEIWKPGAFASSGRHSSGSIKRLTIDRSIRNDLFSRPAQPALPAPSSQQSSTGPGAGATEASTSSPDTESHSDAVNKLKKRVSFDNNTTSGHLNSETGALVRTETDETDDGDGSSNTNGDAARGNELAAVPEDQESNHVSSRSIDMEARSDPKPGDYWMKPSRAEMAKIPREQLQKYKDFKVGRYGCGQVTFNSAVDLNALPLDDLYDKLVEIRLRSITVYPDPSTKPPVGRGLNVPSTIALENSWPRARNQPSSATGGPIFDKHINRLKKIGGTEFVSYEAAKGIWTFRVPHYTRYGLDYDDDDDDDDASLDTPLDSGVQSPADESRMEVDANEYDSGEDDTFAFRQTRSVPGGFGRRSTIDGDFEQAPQDDPSGANFAGDDSSDHSGALSEDDISEDEPSMVGAYPEPANLTYDNGKKPIFKAPGTPGRRLLDLDGDWADQLQQTISPRKQNRDLLRDVQSKVLLDRAYSPIKPRVSQKAFRTSVDVMSSIFGKYEESRMSTTSQGSASGRRNKDSTDFEFPYAKRPKVFNDDLAELSTEDRHWLQSFKTHFDNVGCLVLRKSNAASNNSNLWTDNILIRDGREAIVKSRLKLAEPVADIASQLASASVILQEGVPYIKHNRVSFAFLASQSSGAPTSIGHPSEQDLFTLAHVLFDDYEDQYTLGIPEPERENLMPLIRRDRLTDFLSAYLLRKYGDGFAQLDKENPTAAAVFKLTAHDIKGACDSLEKAKNYKLMLLVSQLGHASQRWQTDIKDQIVAWRDQNSLSEMSVDVRALYEICSGNVTICQGRSAQNVPIEDKAATFALSEEFELSWLQAFTLGLWYGVDEKDLSQSSQARIEHAVQEYWARCERGEESAKPGDDAMWALLRIYAALQGSLDLSQPVFPAILDSLSDAWDCSTAFRVHHAIVGNIDQISVDHDQADQLAALLAWQASSRGDISHAVYALLHVRDPQTRAEMVQALLEKFAATLPEPSTADETSAASGLWAVLGQELRIPSSWLYTAKAVHARAVCADGRQELRYLVSAESWDKAHECFARRVAPGCVVDADYETLVDLVELFGDDAENKISGWYASGGVFADFARLVSVKGGPLDADLVESVRQRLVSMGNLFAQGPGTNIDLGKLPVEELEERVAVKEMSGVVASMLGDARDEILELPITSDLRLKHSVAMTGV